MDIDEGQNLQVAEIPDVHLFGRWSLETIDVSDMSLGVSKTLIQPKNFR